MKIQRIIYILIACCLLFVSNVHAEDDQKRISFSLSVENEKLCLTTSMVSEQPFSIELPEGIKARDLFNVIKPDILPEMMVCFAETIIARNNEKSTEIQTGFFSGDLFDLETEKQVIVTDKEDMQLMLSDLISRIPEKEMDAETKNSIERIIQLLIRQIYENETTISISTYDQGHYLTVDISGKQGTMLIISVDLSEKDTYRIVTGRGTGGAAVYYDEISCKQNGTETDYIFSLYRTTAPTFRMVREQDCVQFAEIRVTDQGDKSFEFKGEIHSVLLPEAVGIIGNRPAGEEKVSIEMNIGGREEEMTEVLMPILFNLMTP